MVLNCANIGCAFGENFLKLREKKGRSERTEGSVEGFGFCGKFSWEGVERALKFYDAEGFTVHAIIGQRLLHKAGSGQISSKPFG